MRRAALVWACALGIGLTSPLGAQAQRPGEGPPPVRRERMERQLRQGLWRVAKERVAAALDRLLQVQRSRLDIVAEEQRDLAAFMTPVQRARYAALQEQLRRRVQTMQRRRAAAGPGGMARP